MNKISCLNNFIEKCQCVYDVGSDHALLAISLIKDKKIKKVINIEINNGPLNQGIKNLKKNHCLSQTENIVNDGLINITKKTPFKPNYICIAGMGGNTIISILNSRDKKLKNTKYILQANCEFDLLRKWLAKNKWETISEQTVCDRNKYYQIILVKPVKKVHRINDFNAYFGNKKYQKDLKTWKQHILFTKAKIEKKKLNKFNKSFAKLYTSINKEVK